MSYFGFNVVNYKQDEKKIKEHILFMIINDLQPISIVEDDGFRKFVSYAYSNFEIPSRSTMTRFIETKYTLLKQQLGIELNKIENLGVTTDGWTSNYTNKSFTAVTLHYIEPLKCELKSIVI